MCSRKEQSDINRKMRILRHAEQAGNISSDCRYYGLSRDTFYKWKRGYLEHGENALINSIIVAGYLASKLKKAD